MLVIDKNSLYEEYVVNGKTDKQIAFELDVDRTYISKLRKQYNILTRKSTGELGEEKVKEHLKSLNINFEDMNAVSKLSSFDLLCNGLKIEIKSSKEYAKSKFNFVLTEKPSNQNIESDIRIKFENGRTKKIFSKTCNYFIFVCLKDNKETIFYIVPSEVINEKTKSFIIKDKDLGEELSQYRDRWDLLK